MKLIDDLIVDSAVAMFRGVMAVGTGLVYIQFLALIFVLSMAGSIALAVVLAAAKVVLFGG
ncbi:MAG: hypothetical protein IBX56_14110 [Methylomicrobium sp.]|jgi:hypothetical protein|nr:hypothetical protein [Methylomicrobium sp.]